VKRKRTEKQRGGRTHGRGKKAGRGAGLRGGRGNAGLLKHNHMKMIVNDPDHFGRKGFKRAPSLTYEKSIINVGDVQSNLTTYLETGIATKEGKAIIVDLTQTDAVKLLGAGKIRSPLTIKIYEATDRAKEKVKAAGGKVELPFEPEPDVAVVEETGPPEEAPPKKEKVPERAPEKAPEDESSGKAVDKK
jgi:large subunit ribosomal protein L15